MLWLFLGILILLPSKELPASAGQQQSHRLIRVAIDDNYPPYIFRDESGNIQGILVDQWRLFEQKTGARVHLMAMDWGNALETMRRGEADVIDTIFFTEERAKIFEYGRPYATIDVPIFFHNSISGISGMSSLHGFRIAVKRGDACIDMFRAKGLDKGLVEYDSYEAIVRDAAQGRIRVFCIDKPPAYYFLNKYNITDQFNHTIPLYSGKFHRAVAKGNKKLLAFIEKGFDLITQSEYEAIDRKWMGQSVPSARFLKYVWIGLAALGSILIILAGFTAILRQRVKAKTAELVAANARLQEEIDQRSRAEAALRESEGRYRLLADNASDIIFTLDMNLRFTYISPSVKRIRGYDVEEAMAQALDEALTPESLEKAMEAFREEMALEATGTAPLWRTRVLELEERCKDGSTIITETTLSPLRDEHGRMKGIMGITRDITERKRSERERAYLESRLVEAQRLESLGTLAGGVAHDFNNLLAGILGNVSLVRMSLPEQDPRSERLRNVEEYVKRGSDLTKQLLGFARGGRYEAKPTHLGVHLRKSSEMFARTRKEVTIHYSCAADLWTVEVDRSQMEQVLLNLYMNAWQAMPEGGDIFLDLENVSIDEALSAKVGMRPGRYVRMTVRDTGIGMDEKIRSRIFEPFFSTKERSRGTGLGLASVYGIIRNHGGYIKVESEPGKGSSFMVYLPATDREPIAETDDRYALQRGDETILLIDDEAMIRDVGSRMLESLGYTVITAADGREGLRLYEENRGRVSLVVLDMVMPELSGKETFMMLRRIDPTVKVLLASGYSLDTHAKDILDRGCNGFIPKPFSLELLSLKVREILDQTSDSSAA